MQRIQNVYIAHCDAYATIDDFLLYVYLIAIIEYLSKNEHS